MDGWKVAHELRPHSRPLSSLTGEDKCNCRNRGRGPAGCTKFQRCTTIRNGKGSVWKTLPTNAHGVSHISHRIWMLFDILLKIARPLADRVHVVGREDHEALLQRSC